VAALDSVEINVSDSLHGWRYGGGRDLSMLEDEAREAESA
jgi:hypothetical protein